MKTCATPSLENLLEKHRHGNLTKIDFENQFHVVSFDVKGFGEK
jgi:hypothetical protein